MWLRHKQHPRDYLSISNANGAVYAVYSNYTLRITYTAEVNSDDSFVYGDNGNENEVVLTWNNAKAPLTIVNARGFDLPQTGDTGTWLYSVIGIVLMAGAAAAIVIVSKKKSA